MDESSTGDGITPHWAWPSKEKQTAAGVIFDLGIALSVLLIYLFIYLFIDYASHSVYAHYSRMISSFIYSATGA